MALWSFKQPSPDADAKGQDGSAIDARKAFRGPDADALHQGADRGHLFLADKMFITQIPQNWLPGWVSIPSLPAVSRLSYR